jgi:hypothetical protein
MLDVPQANAKTTAFNDAFAAIGNAIPTKMPGCKRNTEPAAWEYHVASHLLRLADARKKKAQAAAIKVGVMFDHEKQPRPIGSESVVYAGDVVDISVSVTTPATKFDLSAFCADLEKSGVKLLLINRLANKHTSENRAPHKFTSSLVTA